LIDIFDEVSDDLRAERAARLLRRYGALLVLAALLVLIAVGADQTWQYEQTQQAQKAATAYLALTTKLDDPAAALTNPQREAAAKSLESFAQSAPSGYRTLSLLRAAALHADASNLAAASNDWNQVSGDSSADPLLRDLASLLWAQHELGQAPDEAVAARLQPLTVPENPYHALAQETQALLYLTEGKTALAKALFSQIASDPAATDGVRNRADGLLAKLNG